MFQISSNSHLVVLIIMIIVMIMIMIIIIMIIMKCFTSPPIPTWWCWCAEQTL